MYQVLSAAFCPEISKFPAAFAHPRALQPGSRDAGLRRRRIAVRADAGLDAPAEVEESGEAGGGAGRRDPAGEDSKPSTSPAAAAAVTATIDKDIKKVGVPQRAHHLLPLALSNAMLILGWFHEHGFRFLPLFSDHLFTKWRLLLFPVPVAYSPFGSRICVAPPFAYENPELSFLLMNCYRLSKRLQQPLRRGLPPRPRTPLCRALLYTLSLKSKATCRCCWVEPSPSTSFFLRMNRTSGG